MEQYLAYIGTAIGTLLAIWVAYSTNRKSKVEELQNKSDKAMSEYVSTLESRISMMEKHIIELMEDKERIEEERNWLRRENFSLGRRIAELEANITS